MIKTAEVTPRSAVESVYAMIDSIDKAVLGQHFLLETFVFPEMQPYFDDEDNFENCLAKLKNKLTLFLDE